MTDLPPWKTRSSRHLVRDRWISLRADDCVTATGEEVSPYYVLEYTDWVHVVAINASDEVLLIEQYRHGLAQVCLELPAGRMDPGDAGPEATAMRELKEETGAEGDVVAVLPAWSTNPATHNNKLHTVVLRNVRITAEQAPDPTETIRNRWCAIDEALQLARSGKMMSSMQLGSLIFGLEAIGCLAVGARV
ncbi:NUDIX hydrolase [Phenylobacterium sp.]|uniref:NUDIX hydrolase n=1 Tax=Phenylobacterium sp. TaxID=1871053 RepID=UPI0035B4169E